MRDLPLSTIAQVLFGSETMLNIAQIAGEMNRCLAALKGHSHVVEWDCDDLVTFEFSGTRIILANADNTGDALVPALTLSVGPSDNPAEQDAPDNFHERLINRIVDRIQQKYFVEAILWQQSAGPVTPELIDSLNDTLPARILEMVQSKQDVAAEPAPDMTAEVAPVPCAEAQPSGLPPLGVPRQTVRQINGPPHPLRVQKRIAAHRPSIPAADAPPIGVGRTMFEERTRLRTLRSALYEVHPDDLRLSPLMRLSTHAMTATLITVSLPLGSVAFAYNLYRGESMALTSRLMLLAGTVLLMTDTPFVI